MIISRNKKNLKKFKDAIDRAYAASKRLNKIPVDDISVYDRLVACPAVVQPPISVSTQPIEVHRQWRRKVAKMYYRETQTRPGFSFFGDINWGSIWTWLLEHILPVMKMLLVIVPFII